MKVTLLGTGGSTGVPMLGGPDGAGDWGACDPLEPRNRRTRSSIVIEGNDGRRLLVDTSPDMRAQLLTCRVPSVHAILYTHAHADHIGGIDDVRMLNRIIDSPLDAYGTAATLAEIGRRFGYAVAPWTGPGFYRPALRPAPVVAGEIARILGLDITLFAQAHGRVETLGLRIGDFAYSTDVAGLDDAAFRALAGVRTWVVGCFLARGTHSTHANLATVLGWVDRLRPARVVLTHLGPGMDFGWLRDNLPSGVECGYDSMTLDAHPEA